MDMAQNMLRTLIQAGAIIALLTGTASAQGVPMKFPLKGDSKRPMTPEEIEKQKAADNAYHAAMEKIPEKKAVDPWGNIRPSPATASKNKQQ
jgi:hypothetical protein